MADEPTPSLDLSSVVEMLRPYLPGLVETIGLAGQSATKDGKKSPGDVKAASIGLELVSKYLSGKGSSASSELINLLRQVRKDDPETALGVPTEDEDGSDESDSE